MSTPDPGVLRNASRRPVELHLRSGTVVLLPGETIAAPSDDPYSVVLERRGVLTRHARPPQPAPSGTGGKKPTRKKTRKATASKPTASKTTAKKTAKKTAAKKTTAKKTAAKTSPTAGAPQAAVKDQPTPH